MNEILIRDLEAEIELTDEEVDEYLEENKYLCKKKAEGENRDIRNVAKSLCASKKIRKTFDESIDGRVSKVGTIVKNEMNQ